MDINILYILQRLAITLRSIPVIFVLIGLHIFLTANLTGFLTAAGICRIIRWPDLWCERPIPWTSIRTVREQCIIFWEIQNHFYRVFAACSRLRLPSFHTRDRHTTRAPHGFHLVSPYNRNTASMSLPYTFWAKMSSVCAPATSWAGWAPTSASRKSCSQDFALSLP